MKSGTIGIYTKFLKSASEDQIELVDSIYKACEDNYCRGGDLVVECYSPEDVLETFESLEEVKEMIKDLVEEELNCRWGSDDDPQLERYERSQEEWE